MAQDNFAARMPDIGFKGRPQPEGQAQTLMMALRKDTAVRPRATPQKEPPTRPTKSNQPTLMQALEMAGMAPDAPTAPGEPGASAQGQAGELGGQITAVDVLRKLVNGADGDDDSGDFEGDTPPGNDSEERRKPKIDAELAAQREVVLAVVARAAKALSINPADIDVNVDPAGGPAAAKGTRGVQQGNTINLAGGTFDPGTPDGERLITHEVIHHAQRGLPGMGDDPIGMAEAEATLLADRFIAGGGMGAVKAGLPHGHVAAENGGGAELTAMIAQYRQTLEGQAQTVAPIGDAPAGGGGNATQNRASKVRQYTDGVYGIAEQIGGLAAFDELCDALGTFGDGETDGPLNRVRSSGPYRELCRMWQGAKEGGEDAPAMMRAFDNEFDGRGFWGSTEDAFDLVQAAAKRDARPEPEADSARADSEAAPEAAANAENALDAAGADGAVGGAAGPTAPGQAVSPRMAALMNASVEADAPTIDSFAALSDVTDEQLEAVMAQSRHFDSFSQRAADGEFSSRASQVFETLGENFANGFIASGSDTLLDGLVFDQVGFFADQGLKLVTRGRLSTPMVGPLIGLVQAPPWEASSWGADQASSALENFGQMGETWAAFEHAQEPMDYVGIFCALLADLFGGLRDLLDAIATFCGTLSAMCYVVGGLLILFGIALLWLAGVGAPLVTAGGWLTRAAGILGRINSALGPIVLALSAITIFFRTLSALMVPAELYANQLAGVGNAAGTFGEKAGAKAADTAVSAVNSRVQEPIADRVNGRITPAPDGGDAGGNSSADGVNQTIEDAGAAVQQDLADGDGSDTRRPADGDDPDRVRDGDDPDRVPDDDTPAARRSRFRRFVDGAVQRIRTSELASAGRDLIDAIGNPRRAAMEGLPPRLRDDFERRLDHRLREKTAEFERMRQELAAQGPDIDDADKARLEAEIRQAGQELTDLKNHLDRTRTAIADAQAAEAQAQRDREADDDDDDTTRTREQDADDLQQERDRLRTEGERLRGELERVRGQLAERRPQVQERVRAIEEQIRQLETQHQQAQDRLQTAQSEAATAATQRRRELQAEVDRLLREMGDAQDEATRLEREADGIEAARRRAEEARTEHERNQQILQTAEAERDRLGAVLNDQRISFDDPGAGTQNNMSSRQVVGMTAAGVQVIDGRTSEVRTIAFSAVRYPVSARDAVADFQRSLTAVSDAQAVVNTPPVAAPVAGDPAALRAQAQTQRDLAAGLRPEHADAERAAMGNTTPTEHQTAVNTARTEAGALDGQIQTQRGEIERLNQEVTDLSADQRRLEGEVTANRTQVGQADAQIEQAQQDAERIASVNSHRDLATRGSSGNATGGIGSSNAVWGEWLMHKIGAVDGLLSVAEGLGGDVTALRAAGDDTSTGKGVAAVATAAMGLEIETEEQLRAVGTRRAQVEILLQNGPPTDPALLTERRTAAIEAFERYQLAHARAHRAYVAEQIVDQHAQETAALAESGQPIVERSQSMTEPLNTARTTEADRAAQLSGGGETITPSSEPAGGIIGELIMKLAAHGDAMDEQPTAPDPNSGGQIDEGQALAQSENTERTAQSADASGQQRAFIDAAITARAAQEDQVCRDISTLEDKHAEELSIKEEIQREKAAALQERDQHAQTVQQEAGAFNTDFQALNDWRARYEAAAGAVDSE